MAKGDLHVNDYGTVFIVTVKDQDDVVVNISGATTKKFYFYKPSGDTIERNAEFVTDGTDGKIKYVIAVGELDIDGAWQYQAYVVLTSGAWRSDAHTFMVLANL